MNHHHHCPYHVRNWCVISPHCTTATLQCGRVNLERLSYYKKLVLPLLCRRLPFRGRKIEYAALVAKLPDYGSAYLLGRVVRSILPAFITIVTTTYSVADCEISGHIQKKVSTCDPQMSFDEILKKIIFYSRSK